MPIALAFDFLLRGRAVTPAGSAAPAVRADTHAAEHGPGTSRGATRPTATGECSGRQLLFGVDNLHAKWQVTSVEFCQVPIDPGARFEREKSEMDQLSRIREAWSDTK